MPSPQDEINLPAVQEASVDEPMTWTVSYLVVPHYVKVVTAGKFSLDGQRRMIEDIVTRNFWRPGMNVLFDNRKLYFGQTSVGLMEEVRNNHAQNDKRIGNGKTALLMNSLADFARGRQLEMLAQGKISARLRIFKDEEEALSWLLSTQDSSC